MSHDTAFAYVPESVCPVETLPAEASEAKAWPAVLRRPDRHTASPILVMLHGGLDPLPAPVLHAIVSKGWAANRFLQLGFAVVVATRSPRPDGRANAQAIDDTRRVIDASRRVCGDGELVLFGSSGGGDLALEVAGDTRPVAIVLEEPATSLLTGILAVDTPKRGATWAPDEVWPSDYSRHYSDAHRAATRETLARIDCPLVIAQGDQDVEGVDPRIGLERVLVPELAALEKRVTRQHFPGQSHGFAFLTGVAPGPVADATRLAVERFLAETERFIRAALRDPPAARAGG